MSLGFLCNYLCLKFFKIKLCVKIVRLEEDELTQLWSALHTINSVFYTLSSTLTYNFFDNEE